MAAGCLDFESSTFGSYTPARVTKGFAYRQRIHNRQTDLNLPIATAQGFSCVPSNLRSQRSILIYCTDSPLEIGVLPQVCLSTRGMEQQGNPRDCVCI
jgi:hypothetical protein